MRGAGKYIVALLCLVAVLGACCKNPEPQQTAAEEESVTGFYDLEAAKAATADRGRAMEMPARMKGVSELVLKRSGYYVSYNKHRRVPNWVAWHLTADHTTGDHYRDGQEFAEDHDVPAPRATLADYYGSGYDRGHLCPSGDNKWSSRAQRQSFLLTNVCPQAHDLNKGDWNDLEIQCRYWAKRMDGLYIVTGPVFYDGVKKTIGKNKVAVPDAFFKVLLSDSARPKCIGFIYPNKRGHKDMNEYLRPVDEIERITGIDFFPLLDDEVERVAEAAGYDRMMRDWNVAKAVSYYNSRSK